MQVAEAPCEAGHDVVVEVDRHRGLDEPAAVLDDRRKVGDRDLAAADDAVEVRELEPHGSHAGDPQCLDCLVRRHRASS
jgi:hypothetical protein